MTAGGKVVPDEEKTGVRFKGLVVEGVEGGAVRASVGAATCARGGLGQQAGRR